MSTSEYGAADLLVVAMLQPQSAAGSTAKEIQKASLARLIEDLEPGARAVTTTEHLFEQLTAAGCVRREKARFQLTGDGRARAYRVLGLTRELGPTKWDALYMRHLTAAALGIAPGLGPEALERLGKADGLRRELVRQHFSLPLEPVPHQKPFSNALGWALLERGGSPEVIARARAAKKSFAVGAIIDVLCLTSAGLGAYAENQGVTALARQIAGATGRDWKDLYRAVVLRRFRSTRVEEERVSNGVGVRARMQPPFESTMAFAERVLAAAKHAPTGRVGEHLVFISHVWRELRRRGSPEALDAFKARLVEAYRAHALHLTKADMPQTFDPEDLAQSSVLDRDVNLVFVETRGVLHE